MSAYEAVIGLEVHVHLATASKLFCSCPNSFGDEPNTNVCEVCSGMPGVLPVLNRKAVEFASRMAMAIDAKINQRSQFARKNYFYPDMPKDYQISQFELPLCEHGHLDIAVNGRKKRIGITRIHMEDDAGKNIHPAGEKHSCVDLNRAGTPLIEIVSEPDLRSAEEAVAYLKKLHAIVVSLGISNGNMEEGCFRCDANVSLRPRGQEKFGTRTELKNLNSFRNVQRAIEFEIARQTDVLDDGDKVIQETRLYDANKNITLSMRSKEDAQDYRYFPDPDLLPVLITDEELAQWAATQPELPEAKMGRWMEDFQLAEEHAEQLVADPAIAAFFEKASALCGQPKKVANIIL
ncbi:MAG: Asp-tRNA(Asn)/Glu-tRNA(Gln) amidotransferase subunit GatB, partial [Mailhella sp.]|nr:Asp-tRNA(Asn)/Glu-tRNA(Gln) amidotransferase subunit GatB [Mailhella sp.]